MGLLYTSLRTVDLKKQTPTKHPPEKKQKNKPDLTQSNPERTQLFKKQTQSKPKVNPDSKHKSRSCALCGGISFFMKVKI